MSLLEFQLGSPLHRKGTTWADWGGTPAHQAKPDDARDTWWFRPGAGSGRGVRIRVESVGNEESCGVDG